MKIDLYLDCEWQLNQNIFLIGWAYSTKQKGQLFHRTIGKKFFRRILLKVTGRIFFYGPDIGMLEKFYKMNIRKKFNCVNLIKVFRDTLPGLKSYKLKDLEIKFGIVRKSQRYKTNIFKIFSDWHKPWYRKEILKYNMDDVINLILIKQRLFKAYHITVKYLNSVRLR